MRDSLKRWVVDAVVLAGGKSTPTEVAKNIWAAHEADLRASGDGFYTWQYDMRWAAQRLRDEGLLGLSPDRKWVLAKTP